MSMTDAQILYDVYSNVEDPDGFYGIKSTEIKQSLLRRYHHEGQWSQAFEQHGAIYQTGVASSRVTDDVLISLEALGFHRIASHLITNLRETDRRSSGVVEPIEYEIAWRNGNWDLPTAPASVQSDSRVSLYTSLRAAARERHSQEAIAKVYGAIRIELQRLNGIGFESITRIRDVVKTLLSLREVACCLQTYTSKSFAIVNDEPSTIPSYE
jgi:ataxia telangiectasia mutated family protein